MPRKDDALLLDMLIACRKLIRFTQDLAKDDFLSDDLVQSATLREFQVLGEASRMISDESKSKYQQIPWKVISGLRNRIIHEYFNVDLNILWETIQTNIPELLSQLNAILPDNEDL
ncbi:MAG: DUF86 domain-containing protein [Phototrophicaceae bacterium]